LFTVDIDPAAGDLVPEELKAFVTFHRGMSSQAFRLGLERDHAGIDLFFHDSLHTYMNALGELTWFAPYFRPGSVIICHDAKMDYMPDFGVGRAVREFTKELHLPYRILDTTCGMALIHWPENVPFSDVDKLQAAYERNERQARIRGFVDRASHRLMRMIGGK
jgi:hypothetical protein